MAGRKPPGEPNFFSTLLGKLGLERASQPAPKKAGGGKRRRKRRPDEAGPGGVSGYAPEGDEGASPFADYDAHGGLMEQPGEGEFADTLTYEAAAAAGDAPPTPTPALPAFGGASPAIGGPERPASAPSPLRGEGTAAGMSAPAASAPADGRLFSEDGLDNSLDALFSGLESGMAPPPLPPMAAPPPPSEAEAPLFDEFGLTPAAPVAEGPPPPPPAPPGPRPIHKPIVSEATAAPAAGSGQASEVRTAPNTPLSEIERAPSEVVRQGTGASDYRLPPPTVLALATGVNLGGLLAAIDRTAGVAGSLIVGYDGLIIASSLPEEIDADYLGAQATNLFMGNRGQLEKMRRGELRRIILETASGAMLVTAADMGILVVVSHEGRAMDIGGVMAAIGGALGQA